MMGAKDKAGVRAQGDTRALKAFICLDLKLEQHLYTHVFALQAQKPQNDDSDS